MKANLASTRFSLHPSGRRLNTLFLILLLPCLASCVTRQAGKDLLVSLVNVRFTEATALETTAEFAIRIQNASPDTLRLEGGTHRIYLNGHFVGQGSSGDIMDVPRFGDTMQTVRVYLRNLSLATGVKSILEGKAFDYRLKSGLYTVQGQTRRKLDVTSEGHLDLRDFEPTRLQPATRGQVVEPGSMAKPAVVLRQRQKSRSRRISSERIVA